MKLSVLAGLFVVLLSASAQAGSLFPPENIGSDPSVPCPNGQVLKWNGDSVVCNDPSPGVTIPNCPANQVLVGIANGAPVCRNGYGGTFTRLIGGTYGDGQKPYMPAYFVGCFMVNPLTGACSCPAGFAERLTGGFDNRDLCAYYNSPGACGIMSYGCY